MKIARHLPFLTTALTCMHVSSNAHNPVDSSEQIRSYEHMIIYSASGLRTQRYNPVK